MKGSLSSALSREALAPPSLPPSRQALRAGAQIQAGTDSECAACPAAAARGREEAEEEPGHPGPLPGARGPNLCGGNAATVPQPRRQLRAAGQGPATPRSGRPGGPTTTPLPTPRAELLLLGPLEAKGSHCRFDCWSLGW